MQARIPKPIQKPNFPRVNSTSFFVAVQHNISNWFTMIADTRSFDGRRDRIVILPRTGQNCPKLLAPHVVPFCAAHLRSHFCALPTSGDMFVRRGRDG
jgi:hypothetical protein